MSSVFKKEPQDQNDLVKEGSRNRLETVTELVRTPDVEKLHLRSRSEIAEAIVTVLKSRPDISRVVYEVGKGFEVTFTRNAL